MSWRTRILALTALTLTLGTAACTGEVETESQESELRNTSLDADSYSDRIKMIEAVVKAHPFPKGSSDVWDDPRGGIHSLTGWQLRSKRATQTWWQNTNRVLNVWPVQILQQYRGELRDITIVHGVGDAKLKPTREVVRTVLAFYDAVDSARKEVTPNMSTTKQFELSRKLLRLNWEWHNAALAVAFERNQEEFKEMPAGEQKFAHSWGFGMLPVMFAAQIETTTKILDVVISKQLPQRLARSEDYAYTRDSDLSVTCRASIRALRAIDELERKSKGKFSKAVGKLAKKTSSPYAVSHAIQVALESGTDAPKVLLKELAKLAGEEFVDEFGDLLDAITFWN